MKKNGFTLTELIATIAIFSLIISMVIASYMAVSNKVKKEVLKTKRDSAISAAKMYASDNNLIGSHTITIETLIDNGYISKDDLEADMFQNPVNSKSMNDCEISIVQNKNKYKAFFTQTNNEACKIDE